MQHQSHTQADAHGPHGVPKAGVEAAASNQAALLLFSGGATRVAAGPLTEGASYWAVTNAASWFGQPAVRERCVAVMALRFAGRCAR